VICKFAHSTDQNADMHAYIFVNAKHAQDSEYSVAATARGGIALAGANTLLVDSALREEWRSDSETTAVAAMLRQIRACKKAGFLSARAHAHAHVCNSRAQNTSHASTDKTCDRDTRTSGTDRDPEGNRPALVSGWGFGGEEAARMAAVLEAYSVTADALVPHRCATACSRACVLPCMSLCMHVQVYTRMSAYACICISAYVQAFAKTWGLACRCPAVNPKLTGTLILGTELNTGAGDIFCAKMAVCASVQGLITSTSWICDRHETNFLCVCA
jgi:hypothetical protein